VSASWSCGRDQTITDSRLSIGDPTCICITPLESPQILTAVAAACRMPYDLLGGPTHHTHSHTCKTFWPAKLGHQECKVAPRLRAICACCFGQQSPRLNSAVRTRQVAMQRPRYRRCIVAPSAMQDSGTNICLPNCFYQQICCSHHELAPCIAG